MKNLGQYFLIDHEVAERIVESIEPSEVDVVLEIGAGKGVLTELLVDKVKKLLVVEIDKNLCNFLTEKFKNKNNIEILNTDFLKINFNNFGFNNLKIIGNIPYSITSKILYKLYEGNNFWQVCVLMLQYEVGRKLTAKPSTSEFSQLTLVTDFYTKVNLLFKVDRNCFVPQPKVDSCVVKFVPNKEFLDFKHKDKLFWLISSVFKHKRKTLINSLNYELGVEKQMLKKIVVNLGIKLDARPQDLGLVQYIKLLENLSEFISISTT